MSAVSTSDRVESTRRVARWIILTKCIGALLVIAAICLWWSPFSGGQSGRFFSDDVLISLDGSQFNYGCEKIFAMAGQTLTVSANCQIEKGQLSIYVWRSEIILPATPTPPLSVETISQGAHATKFDIPIDRTGFYRVDLAPWREQNRYDISYDVSWQVH